MAAQNKPVPVPTGFKFGPGAVGTVPAKVKTAIEVYLGGPDPTVAPVSILDVPNPETGYVPPIVAAVKAKAKKAKAPKPAPVPTVTDIANGTMDLDKPMVPAPAPDAVGVPLLGSKGTTFQILLPPDLLAKIQKPVTGMGGWQRVMLELKAGTVFDTPGPPDPVTGLPFAILTLTPNLLDRLITLAVKHGSGGYQSVIRHIVCLALSQHKAAILGGQ